MKVSVIQKIVHIIISVLRAKIVGEIIRGNKLWKKGTTKLYILNSIKELD
jgi:hypothetical protein